MPRTPEIAFSRETVLALREFLGDLPQHPAFDSPTWCSGDYAAAAAAAWVSVHRKEAALLVAALSNLFAHAERKGVQA